MLIEKNYTVLRGGSPEIAAASKKYLGLKEAAEYLGVTEHDIRMRVGQGILRPIGGYPGEKPSEAYTRDRLMFHADELRSQWELFRSSQLLAADGIRLILKMLSDLIEKVDRLEAQSMTKQFLSVPELARALRVHEVTLRKRVRPVSRDRLKGRLDLWNGRTLNCEKLDGRSWMFSLEDVKKIL